MVRSLRLMLVALVATVVAVAMAPPTGAAPGVTVAGTVVDDGGDPIAGITVTVSSGATTVQAVTGPDGTYTTASLPDGAYNVSFADTDGMAPHRPTRYWPAAWTAVQSSPLVLSAATSTEVTGIGAELPLAASVSGTITDPQGDPIDGACANAWARSGDESMWITNAPAAPDGTYSMVSLPPIDVVIELVDCSLPMTWLPTELPSLPLSAGSVLTGVDGQLRPGAAISGTVHDTAGAPLADICASEVRTGPDGDEWGMTVATDADGAYLLSPLAEGEVSVELRSCDDQPYLPAVVGPVTVAAGATVDVGDTELVRATLVSGTVRDADGAPVADVCVQLADGTHVGGWDETDADGTYAVPLADGGEYRAQFVDCRDTPELAGTSRTVTVVPGTDLDGIDVTMEAGAAASVTGIVTNVRGEPLAGVCVVAYLAYGRVLAAITDAEGSYAIGSLGSGVWALAYLTCAEDDGPDVDPAVVDTGTGVAWAPLWWGGSRLELIGVEDPGPDPIEQGATLVELGPGASSAHDICFGCDAISAAIELDGDTVRATFVADGLASGVSGPAAAATEPTYTLLCTPVGDITTQGLLLASGEGGELVASGVDPDVAYSCAVAASVDGLVVARSAVAVVGQIPASGGTTPTGAAGSPRSAGTAAAPLSFVG